MNYLKLTFESDDDGTGELFAEFSANGFSGHGSAWFDVGEIIEKSKRFGLYPLPTDNYPTLEGGGWESNVPSHLIDEQLYISAYPIDSRGNIGILVRASTGHYPEERKKSRHYISVEFRSCYEDLSRFAKNLPALVKGTLNELTLYETKS